MSMIRYPYITRASQWVYENASQAFECLVGQVVTLGNISGNTIRLENIGFYIDKPERNRIVPGWRNWNSKYAEREWNWYLSHSRDVSELQKFAPTWKNMHGGDNQVNSNYGWLWNRNKQLEKVIEKLKNRASTRQAWLTLYDGKEIDDYEYDTPCTLNIGFKLKVEEDISGLRSLLDMTVLMRSNDLIFGFCNDQFCFSQLQKYVASKLNVEVGSYYHFAQDLHIYLPNAGIYPERINNYLKSEYKL